MHAAARASALVARARLAQVRSKHACIALCWVAHSPPHAGTPGDRRGVAAAGGASGCARQARFLWDPALRSGVFDNIEAELALRVTALASGAAALGGVGRSSCDCMWCAMVASNAATGLCAGAEMP